MTDEYNITITSSIDYHTASLPRDKEFRGYSAMPTKFSVGITHTLTGGITQEPIKCIASAYAWLKDTKRTRYRIVYIQILLHTLIISVYDYTPLCNQIPYEKCFQFDRTLHFKYIKYTKYTVTQLAHTVFLSRNRYGLHIGDGVNCTLVNWPCAIELDPYLTLSYT